MTTIPTVVTMCYFRQRLRPDKFVETLIWLIQQCDQAGVMVRVLLEGGEVTDRERWLRQRLHAAGGKAYFLHMDDDADIHARYRNQHAKAVM